MMLLVLSDDGVVLSKHLPISAEGAFLGKRPVVEPGPPEFLGDEDGLLFQVLYFLLHFPLPQAVVLFLLAKSKLILFDQGLGSEIMLLLGQSLTMFIDDL